MIKYSKEYLRQPDLLLHSSRLNLRNRIERAFFIGVYGKAKFPRLGDFVMFTMNISSITQDWYSTSDLDSAYQYHYPPDQESPKDGDLWLLSSKKSSGSLLDWLKRHNVPVEKSKLPAELCGSLFWVGDGDEVQLIGETSTAYFEVFLADC